MEKFIIVAGSPNSGKTLSVNMAIQKLLVMGATIVKYLFGSCVDILEQEFRRCCYTFYKRKANCCRNHYGDIASSVNEVFTNSDVLSWQHYNLLFTRNTGKASI